MIIHCTRKLAAMMPAVSTTPLDETSPMGSWHANLLRFDRRQCLFFCHDLTRAVLFLPGVRKSDLQRLGDTFPVLLTDMLRALGCEEGLLPRVGLALGPLGYDSATDRSVLASMTIAKYQLEAAIFDARHVLDVDPIAMSAWISRRPASIRGKPFIWPDRLLFDLVRTL